MKPYDVVIIGGGISGTALLYELASRGSVGRVALLEKYDSLAAVNSHGRNNSQTLHCGDIETNYTLEKALQVKQTAQMVVDYTQTLPETERDKLIYKYPKMVLAVGDRECELLTGRFDTFKHHFDDMELLDAAGIAKVEPEVVKGRKERVMAIAVRDQYSAVDFNRLAHSFAQRALQLQSDFELHLGTRVKRIQQQEQGFVIDTGGKHIHARTVVVSAGGHSLLFAQQMGYGTEYACLPVACPGGSKCFVV